MTIVERMRVELKAAMKARDAVKTGFLRYWIAQFTLGSGAELADAEAVKKMRGILKEAKSGPTSFSEQELALLRDWVPPTLSSEQIAAALIPIREAIKAAPKDGMALGVAMKALAGQNVDSDDVKVAVASIRQ
ncbi:MAG TPA: GatB/YqeY domain-containing protein [Isosphaeraceae bacterium]|nr:GatB/YqeY domain-containing protein [Isosphaeraceae bacterium]